MNCDMCDRKESGLCFRDRITKELSRKPEETGEICRTVLIDSCNRVIFRGSIRLALKIESAFQAYGFETMIGYSIL